MSIMTDDRMPWPGDKETPYGSTLFETETRDRRTPYGLDVEQSVPLSGYRDTHHDGYSSEVKGSGPPIVVLLEPSLLRPFLAIVVLFLSGICVAVLHHLVNRYASGRPIDSLVLPDHHVLSQQWMNRISTALAFITKTIFTGCIGLAMTQRLWYTLRRQGLTSNTLDSLFALQNDPFEFRSAGLWLSAWVFALLAACALSMTVVAIIPPGSLTVKASNYSFPKPCSVPNVNWDSAVYSQNDIHGVPTAAKIAADILIGGNMVVPASPCGECQYNLDFYAPSIQCTNVTDSPTINWTETLPNIVVKSDPSQANWTGSGQVIWNATFDQDAIAENFLLAWIPSGTDDSNAPGLTANCTLYNTSYSIQVAHSASSHTIQVIEANSTPLSTYVNIFNDTTDFENLVAIFKNMRDVLKGTILFGGEVFDTDGVNELPASSSVAVWSNLVTFPTFNHYQVADMFTALPSLMQNITMSLLSVNLTDSHNTSTLLLTNATSFVSANVSHYDPSLLLGTYGAAIFVTAICVLVGLHPLYRNADVGDSSFSRLLETTRNPALDSVVALDDWQSRKKLRFGLARGINGRDAFGVHED